MRVASAVVLVVACKKNEPPPPPPPPTPTPVPAHADIRITAREAKGDDLTVTWTTPDGEVHAICHAHPLTCTKR